MDNESSVCGKCRIRTTCHPRLAPEKIEYDTKRESYTIVPLTQGNGTFCRHYSCPAGRNAAKLVLDQANGNKFKAIVVYSSGGHRRQSVVGFETYEKPPLVYPNSDILGRIVNLAGRIFSRSSLDDPKYYDTGQYAQTHNIEDYH